MILNNETFDKFGHHPETLTKFSRKLIVFQCDYCSLLSEKPYCSYIRSIETYPHLKKDCCLKCRNTKTIESRKILGTQEETINRSAAKAQKTKKDKYGEFHYRDTMLSRWANKSTEQKDAIFDKMRSTCLEKYGVEHPSKVKEVRKKTESTMLERYGVVNPSQCQHFQDKKVETSLKKYGHKHWASSPESKKRIREINLKKYGVESVMGTPEFIEKSKEECRRLYGVDSPLQSDIIKERVKQTCLEKYGVENPASAPEVIQKGIDSRLKSGTIKLYEGKRIHEWATEQGISRTYAGQLLKKYGTDFVKTFEIKKTNIEQLISNLLDKNSINYIYNNALPTVGLNIRPDFQLPDFKIVIEADGLFYHCDQQKPDDYHVKKRQIYLDNGYSPLFFRSNEIETKLPVVESIILNKLGLCSSRLHGRKCEIVTLSRKEAQEFLNDNHLMGQGAGKCFALKYNNEIVAALQVKNKNIKENLWEISRFCTKLNTSISGGYSKLIKYFISTCSPAKIISFCDLRYGSGSFLEKLGWKLESCYPSFSWTDGETSFHRMKFKGNDGYRNGLTKIWDCGQAKYTLNCN